MKDTSRWEIISTYSIKQAVNDGFLEKVDSDASKEAPFLLKFEKPPSRKVVIDNRLRHHILPMIKN